MELTFVSPPIEQLRHQLQDAPQIDFAFLFGSYADGTNNDLSDIDVAVHFRGEYTLLDVGEITALLEKTSGRRVDVIPLNGLYRRDPAFAFEIISTGTLLLCHNDNALTHFKRKTFLYYLDVKPMLEMVKTRFVQRLADGHLAEPRHAR